jgi:hypothetical protein
VAIQSTTDPVWSMKQWAYYDELTNELKPAGFKGEHTAEPVHRARASGGVQDYRCLVSGDSSPMHWRWAAVPDPFRFLPARVHEKCTKHLVSIRVSTHSDKMRIGDIPSRSTLFLARLSAGCAERMKICTR